MTEQANVEAYDENTADFLNALAAVQDAVSLVRDGVNPHFNSSYTPLPELLTTLRPVMREHGLVDVFQVSETTERGDKLCVTATLTLFHAPTGKNVSAGGEIPLAKTDAHGYGAAITYLRRYLLVSLLGLIEADDDGNAASDVETKPAAKQSSSRKSGGTKKATRKAPAAGKKKAEKEEQPADDEDFPV